MQLVIVGDYNRWGYSIFEADTGREIYTSGNSQYDSGASLDPGTPGALPLRTIRSHCIGTAREIAAECGGVYGGVERGEE